MGYTITVTRNESPKYYGNIKIKKRSKESQIGFVYNSSTGNTFFDPAIIDGVRLDKIWGQLVINYIKKNDHDVNKFFLFDEEHIFGTPVKEARYFIHTNSWNDKRIWYAKIGADDICRMYNKQHKWVFSSPEFNIRKAMEFCNQGYWKEIEDPRNINKCETK